MMREFGFIIVALAAVAVVRGEETAPKNVSSLVLATDCPAYEIENQIVYIPHEFDCSMYYVCKAGRKIPLYCAQLDDRTGERLHFNPNTEKCDLPGSFLCGQPSIPHECVGNYKTVHESNCGYYYECVSGRKILRACGGGLHFNTFSQTCMMPDQAGCDVVMTPIPTPRPIECDGKFRTSHESKCGYYYECINGRKTLRACGSGLHFNEYAQTCMTPDQAGCDQNMIPTPTPRPQPAECVGNFKTNHESNCGYYYECVSGKKTLRACGGGLHFNSFSQTCQTPSEAHCSKTPTPKPTPRPSECVGNFKTNHESNCGYYYECVNGKKMLRTCGTGLHFNTFAQTCQTPSEAHCSKTPTPKPTPRPSQCVGNFKTNHESNCGYYYECVNGKKMLRTCGTGLHFNTFAQTCQTPSEAHCSKTPTPKPTPRPSQCVGNFKTNHESNCAYYYECVNGKKMLRTCGTGLHFNTFAQTCQTPSEAHCSKTPTPKPTPRPAQCVGNFRTNHESNCGYYYECVSGKKTLRACGGGLHFNTFAQTCQTPSQAGCQRFPLRVSTFLRKLTLSH